MPKVIELDFSRVDQRMMQLRERADRLQGRSAAIRQHIFDLEQQRAGLAAELATRAKLAERRGQARERPRLPPLPGDLSPADRDAVMQQYAGVLEAARTAPETALADDAVALERLDRLIAGEEAAFRALGAGPVRAVVRLCEEWRRQRHTTPDPEPFLVTIDPELPDDLDALRTLLPRLTAEARRIEAAPVPLAEARERLAATIAAAATQPALDVGPFVAPGGGGVLVSGVMPPQPPRSTDWWRSLAQAAPDAVRSLGERELAAFYERLPTDAAIATSDRVVRLEAVEARRRAIEYAEEALIRSRGERGEAERRSDVRPEFVLAE